MIGKLILILLSVFAISSCGFAWGGCPKVEYDLSNFTVANYTGKWYEIIRDKSIRFESGICQEANYSLNVNGTLTVTNTELINGKVNSVTGLAYPTSNPFRFKISFSNSAFGKLFKGDYQVANTDYTSYSVVYSCTDLYFARFEFFWVLSRNPLILQDDIAEFSSYLKEKFGFKDDQFHYSPQNDCGRK